MSAPFPPVLWLALIGWSYLSPPIIHLGGARIHWNLKSTRFQIDAATGDKPYSRRYMDFSILPMNAKSESDRLKGRFNFWSTGRLLALNLIRESQVNKLISGKNLLLTEKEYCSAIVHSTGSDYNLYIQIYRPPKFTDTKLTRIHSLFSSIGLVPGHRQVLRTMRIYYGSEAFGCGASPRREEIR